LPDHVLDARLHRGGADCPPKPPADGDRTSTNKLAINQVASPA
jgi:hypothetical protein